VEKTTFTNRESFVRFTWEALSALALGVVLGGVSVLGGRQIVGSSLLYTALQAVFSAALLGALAPARSQDLSLDVDSLPVRSELAQECAGERSEWRAKYRCRLGACGAVGAA